MARLVNASVKALNDNMKIPRMIVIVPDHDIINSINFFEFGIKHILHISIRWIINNMQRVLEAKIENLMNIKPGAVDDKPKVIWVKMLQKPSNLIV